MRSRNILVKVHLHTSPNITIVVKTLMLNIIWMFSFIETKVVS